MSSSGAWNKTVLTLTVVKDWSNLDGTGAMEMQA
jgi:hypothetical protein